MVYDWFELTFWNFMYLIQTMTKPSREIWLSNNQMDVFIPVLCSFSVMSHLMSLCMFYCLCWGVFQHIISFPVSASHSFISSFLLIRLPLQCQPTCQSLLLFPPLLTTSSSCGTQRDRSVSESPWCNTTIVTSTLCSLCMMSPARPASAAWLPGLKSAGRTPSDRKFPGNYTGSLQGYKSGFNHHKPFQFDHPETVLLF